MTELGMIGIGSIAADIEGHAGMHLDPDSAPRAHDDIEQVTIETIHVGDYVLLDARRPSAGARCVIKKYAKANERTARVVGWLLELAGGQVAWCARGRLVWRRRRGSHA